MWIAVDDRECVGLAVACSLVRCVRPWSLRPFGGPGNDSKLARGWTGARLIGGRLASTGSGDLSVCRIGIPIAGGSLTDDSVDVRQTERKEPRGYRCLRSTG